MFFIENYFDSVANMIKTLYLLKPLSSSPNINSRLVNVSILKNFKEAPFVLHKRLIYHQQSYIKLKSF